MKTAQLTTKNSNSARTWGGSWRYALAICTVALALTGCSQISPHKISIQQGNIVTQNQVDKLALKMTPRQVKFILGTPLIIDSLDTRQWHYLYSLRLGSGTTMQRRLTLTFRDGYLDRIDNHYTTSNAIDDKSGESSDLNAERDKAATR